MKRTLLILFIAALVSVNATGQEKTKPISKTYLNVGFSDLGFINIEQKYNHFSLTFGYSGIFKTDFPGFNGSRNLFTTALNLYLKPQAHSVYFMSGLKYNTNAKAITPGIYYGNTIFAGGGYSWQWKVTHLKLGAGLGYFTQIEDYTPMIDIAFGVDICKW